MSDLVYFQGLYDTAKDFTMKAFYAAAVRERHNGALGGVVLSISGPRVTVNPRMVLCTTGQKAQPCGTRIQVTRSLNRA